jgi:TlyA family rRNA methyltransferase/putative hemolysin
VNDFCFSCRGQIDHALKEFNLDVTGFVCADLGCSTGGFTDCLLQHGAAKVYSVDTGYGVLDWRLRNDPRVVVLERTNALHVVLPELVDLVTIDVSWTPQRLILPKAKTLLQPGGSIISLIKPHYEAKKAHLTPEESAAVLQSLNLTYSQITQSPILGEKGKNIEYLCYTKIHV